MRARFRWCVALLVACSSSPESTQPPMPTSTARTAANQASFDANLAAIRTPGPGRVVVDPSTRPYARELVGALAQPLDEAALGWFAPSLTELEACERRFLEQARGELEAGTITMLPKRRAHDLAPIFAEFVRYERQAVGWSANGNRYIWLRFRLPSAGDLPLTGEYFAMDGGRAYFELQCALPGLELFAVHVNGES